MATVNKKKKVKKKNNTVKKNKKASKKIKILILLFIAVGLWIYLLKSPLFQITEIKITGNKQITEAEIYELSGIRNGKNIFSIWSKIINIKLKENNYIKDVTIKKKLPGTVEINIEEREKEFQIKNEEAYIYIDEQGYILEINQPAIELITLKGLDFQEYNIEELKRLPKEHLEKLENILRIKEKFKNIELENEITYIDVSNDEYTVYLEKLSKTIHLGDASNLNNKMLYVKALLKQEEGKKGQIFINGNLNEGFKPYFRED